MKVQRCTLQSIILPEVFSKVQLQRCTVQSIDLTFVRKYESTLYESTKVRKYESTFEGSVRVHVRVVRDGLELSLFAIRSTFVHS